jgi:NAD(P)-dependent dehydrogenase (short-subunit alcohol dehydrogenase family)
MRFKDRVAIITGGSQGMGKAAALGFAKEGANVVIISRSEEKLQQAAEEIRAAGGKKVTVMAGDVTSSESIKGVVAKTLKEYGKVEILFNYVGGEPNMSEPLKLFTEQTEDYWDKIITLNIKSTVVFCRAVLDSMIKQKYGKIINTAAIAGRVGSPRMVLYSTVKGGIIAFTKSLAMEVAEYNINVDCVSPGPINTPGFNSLFGEEGIKSSSNFVPLKRMGRPEDVGNAVLYLASDDASFITGQTLAVDGGVTMV